MKMLRAFQIAKREWGNIRTSLEDCGDIGELDSGDYMNGRLSQVEGLSLVRNIIEMENEFPKHGYFTSEAAYVFANLASSAGERLGLTGGLAEIFGSGYSCVRTGCFSLDRASGLAGQKHVIKQLFFFKLFFPVGGDFNWDFDSPVAKTKLRLALLKFKKWQRNPESYVRDVEIYKTQIEPLLRGLSRTMGFPLMDDCGKYEAEERSGYLI